MAKTNQVLELILHGMASQYDPQYARGFAGDIQYVFSGDGQHEYFVSVGENAAEVSTGRADSPAVTIEMPIPTYLRIASGEENGALAMMEGRIQMSGDAKVAIRIGEMFGQSRF